jgi:uncharacterized protein (TIGR00369 family)
MTANATTANATTAELAALGARCEAAPYNRALGLRVETIELDRVRLRVPYTDANSNPGRALHGGVAASTITIAGALAARTGVREAPGLETGTLDLSVDYLAAAIGEDIVAEAEVLRRGKEIVYADVDVRTEAGKRIAKGLVTYRAFDPAAQSGAGERQLHGDPEPWGALGAEVPPVARAIVSVPFMARLGMAITHMRDGRAVVALPWKPENADGDGTVHEGAVAALLDTAGAMASWSVAGLDLRYKASTVGIHISHHAAARGEDVVAQARTLRRNNEIFLNTVTVSGRASGRIVATGSVTYRIVVPG